VRPLTTQPSLADQVCEQILAEIIAGRFAENARLIQDDLAKSLGVSRQPVQQALLLLRNQGFLREAPGRGLLVSPIDIDFVRDLYEIRAVTEGLACRLAAERGSEHAVRHGSRIMAEGRRAEQEGSVAKLIAADMKFHEFLCEISGNRLIKDTMQPYWVHLRRLMGEVLAKDETPRRIWDQHEAILQAVIRGNAEKAEALAQDHIARAGSVFVARLQAKSDDTKSMRSRSS